MKFFENAKLRIFLRKRNKCSRKFRENEDFRANSSRNVLTESCHIPEWKIEKWDLKCLKWNPFSPEIEHQREGREREREGGTRERRRVRERERGEERQEVNQKKENEVELCLLM